MAAVYSPDDLPLRKAPEKIVSCAIGIGQQIKIRGSSKELSQMVAQAAGSSKDPVVGSMSSQMENMMVMNSKLMTAVLDKAKLLDELVSLKVCDPEKAGLLKSGSSSSSLHEPELLSHKALPPAEEVAPLPLPAPNTSEDDTKENDDQQKPCKSLEDYELQAKQSISKRKAKNLDKTLKRPAACKAKPGPKPKAKTKHQPSSSSSKSTSLVKKGIFGCGRCRGNTKGCSTCWSPSFGGLRFSSRQDWVAWKQQQDHCK